MSAHERWARGNAYEPYVGRWSRLVARRFVEWLAPAPGARWLDVGCGTGALTEAILDAARPTRVRGVDPSQDFIAFARAHVADARAEFAVADAQHLAPDDDAFDYVVSALVLNFVADPPAALEEMRRAARDGGWIAAYVWDYAGGMEMMRFLWTAATELDARAASLDEAARFPICRPEPLRSLWVDAGLTDVTVTAIDVDTVFRDFDDFWSPFLGGNAPAPAYVMSLDDAMRAELEALLQARLPVRDDGSIALRARAWAVRGRA